MIDRDNSWHDTATYYPPIGQVVLGWDGACIDLAHIDSNDRWHISPNRDIPTHWMYLPATPRDILKREILTCPLRPYIE